MTLIENKKVFIRYAPVETYPAGLVLSGQEVKSLRAKNGSLDGAHVVVRGGEAYVVGMTIPPYQVKNAPKSYDSEQTRKLLLTKKEIAILADADSRKGLTIVPIEVYTSGRNVKIRIMIARNKGKADKREDLKQRDASRETARILRNR